MAVRLELDHLVISATRLDQGVAHVKDLLGLAMAPGGKHPLMGTHNALLGLGDVYLEVIAIDPEAAAPGHPRWFDLDSFHGPPRLSHWVARTGDLAGALALAPPGAGTPMALSRGDLRWSMAVPADGRLPFGGGFPGLISWQGEAHPTRRLPDAGWRLSGLHITHPQAADLRAALAKFECDPAARVDQGDTFSLGALLSHPGGSALLA